MAFSNSVVPQKLFTQVKANTIHQTEKSQIPGTKLQTNLKSQYPMTETGLRVVDAR
jgi:hypothetical protein